MSQDARTDKTRINKNEARGTAFSKATREGLCGKEQIGAEQIRTEGPVCPFRVLTVVHPYPLGTRGDQITSRTEEGVPRSHTPEGLKLASLLGTSCAPFLQKVLRDFLSILPSGAASTIGIKKNNVSKLIFLAILPD